MASTKRCSASLKLMTFQMAFKYCKRTSELVGRCANESGTHVGLDVLVLQVERVLPDVNADDGDVRFKTVSESEA